MKNTEKINEIHKKFIKYGSNAKEWQRKCILLLPQISKKRIWEKKRFSCIYEYAAKLAGLSKYQVQEALRILKHVEDKPELKALIKEKGINIIKPVATIATKNSAKFWANKAKVMSKNTLEVYVREWKKQNNIFAEEEGIDTKKILPRKDFTKQNGLNIKKNQTIQNPKTPITMNLSPETLEQLKKLKGNNDWETLMAKFIQNHEKQLEKEKPKTVKTNSRQIPKKIKNYIRKKTNGTCAYPGCTKPHKVLHHIDRFALNKEHNPDKIKPLCKEHDQIVHLGLIENESKSPTKWKIRKNADLTDYKSIIDKRVQEYRR